MGLVGHKRLISFLGLSSHALLASSWWGEVLKAASLNFDLCDDVLILPKIAVLCYLPPSLLVVEENRRLLLRFLPLSGCLQCLCLFFSLLLTLSSVS